MTLGSDDVSLGSWTSRSSFCTVSAPRARMGHSGSQAKRQRTTTGFRRGPHTTVAQRSTHDSFRISSGGFMRLPVSTVSVSGFMRLPMSTVFCFL